METVHTRQCNIFMQGGKGQRQYNKWDTSKQRRISDKKEWITVIREKNNVHAVGARPLLAFEIDQRFHVRGELPLYDILTLIARASC